MTNEEWAVCNNAYDMLEAIHIKDPTYFKSLVTQLHRYLIACSWKHKHLIPQSYLRIGLLGAEKWLDGDITDKDLSDLNWYAEAEAFMLDYAKTPEDFAEIQEMIDGIEELKDMTFDEARKKLKAAAYFAEAAMIFSRLRGSPFHKKRFKSEFNCPNLLRQHIAPNFD